MKYTVALAALAAMVSAQSIADLPSCSLSCMITAATQIGCSATDFECSCTKAAELTPSVCRSELLILYTLTDCATGYSLRDEGLPLCCRSGEGHHCPLGPLRQGWVPHYRS